MAQDFTDVNIGSGKGLVSSGKKPLPEPLLTKPVHDVTLWHHQATMS